MAEAIGNVLDNTLRYTPCGGSVLIEFGADPAAIFISDSGPGIPDADRKRVLERFVRGSQVSGDGTGLGLAIVKDTVTEHGARIVLSSSASGGTRVAIYFPAQV